MKRIFFFMFCPVAILMSSCWSTAQTTNVYEPKPPRREYLSLENIDVSSTDPFVVNDFISDDNVFRKGTVFFSTALFLSDVGILEGTPKDRFEKYANVVFSNFPKEGELKEIVLPNLSFSKKPEDEKNAYLFITKKKDNEERDIYAVESNIPTGSMYAKNYDGYVMRTGEGFYKNNIPAGWTAMMNMAINNDILLYRGVAYPQKSGPLIFTGTGIGSDAHMRAILSSPNAITETKNALNETVQNSLVVPVVGNQQQADSIKFLAKFTNISLSAYSYLESDLKEAKKYFQLAKETTGVVLPDDTMGSRYKELEKIMDYLVNIIGE